jgi:hypothetical protein
MALHAELTASKRQEVIANCDHLAREIVEDLEAKTPGATAQVPVDL